MSWVSLTILTLALVALGVSSAALYVHWRDGRRVRVFRRQLAQELHDGLGSDLAGIIAAFDDGTPQQRAAALSLQHCMLELKLLVDGTEQEGSVLAHLASLRYRLQPLLRRAGVDLRWNVSDEETLDALTGEAARQVLRVAQEALANALRHSQASVVGLTCGYVKNLGCLLLLIVDNGVGMPAHLTQGDGSGATEDDDSQGRGLSGMAWRAKQLGGRLLVDAGQGRGTRVQLLIPM